MPPAETAGEAENTLSVSSFGVDLAEAAKLGAQAGGVEIVNLTTAPDAVGLPSTIPVLLKRGEHPAIESVAPLFEPYRLFPKRKEGQASAQTLDAFCDLTNRHKTEHSAVFADANWEKPSFTAVIDYHEATNGGNADFGKHRIHYAFPLSDEWQAWMKLNGEKMTQEDFAYFLEDRIAELSSPTEEERVRFERDFATTIATPSQLVELSRGLQVNVSSKLKTATTLASGEGQLIWEETHQDASGAVLKVPGIFILSISPFFMGEKMRIPVRLRYRAHGGSIAWLYQIYRPDQYVTEHVRHALFDVETKTELPTYEGTPEMRP